MQEKPVDIQFIAERVLRIEQHLEEQKVYDKAMKWRKAIEAERARREEQKRQREKDRENKIGYSTFFFIMVILYVCVFFFQ